MISEGDIHTPASRFRGWIASDLYSYGLHRDLTLPIQPHAAKIPITVRPLRSSDIPALLSGLEEAGSATHDRKDRRKLVKAGINQCYVAATQADSPCYMQWLILPSENEKIQKIFGGLLPWLGSDEILLEQAFTVEAFRGLGIMPCAMAQIAELGRAHGIRWALTFVDQYNIAALKGCQRAGFRPYLIRRESWRFFQQRISFHLLPRGTPFPFDEAENTTAADRLSLAG